MAASKVSSATDAECGICCLVEETRGHEIRYFGPGCLVKLENTQFLQSVGTPKSKFFLVASKEVLAKGHLEALKKQEKERRTRQPTVKMVAEFPGLKDKTKLERISLDQLYVSIKDDVFEFHGITYVSLTKCREQRIFGKSSLLNRALDAVSTEDVNSSSLLTSDQLQCLVFSGGSANNTVENRNVCELSTKVYDLLQVQVDSVVANDQTRFSCFSLQNEEKKRFLREDEFEKDEKPFGSIILSRDYKLAGILNFVKNNPVPVIVGSGSGTSDTGDTHLSHAQGAGVPPEGDTHLSHAQGAGVPPEDFPSGRSSPTENSCRSIKLSSSNNTEQDLKGTVDLVDLPPDNGMKCEPPDRVEALANQLRPHIQDQRAPASKSNKVHLVEVPEDQLQHRNDDQRAPANKSNKVHPVEVPEDQLQHRNDDQRAQAANNNNEVPPVRLPEEQLQQKHNDQWAPTNGILPQDRPKLDGPPQGQDIGRRHTFPTLPSKRAEHPQAKRSSSANTGGRRKFQLGIS